MGHLWERRNAYLAWACVVATLGLWIAGNAFRGATPTRLISSRDLQVVDGWWIRLSFLYALAFVIVGALIVARRPGNLVGWVACGIGLLSEVYSFGLGYQTFGTYVDGNLPGLQQAAEQCYFRLRKLSIQFQRAADVEVVRLIDHVAVTALLQRVHALVLASGR